MNLKRYYYCWLGPVGFFSSLIIQVLHRNQFKWDLDGVFLVLFSCLFVPLFQKTIKSVSWIAIYGLVFCYHHFNEPLYFLAQILSSWSTLKGLKYFIDEGFKYKSSERLNQFYENRLKELLEQKHQVEKRLNTLLEEPLNNLDLESQTDGSVFQDYDEALDLLEAQVAQEFKTAQSEEKKPLKRLRKIAMKQTSFFDDIL